jgi:phospholipid/cholesterol/gamma-HCH transport system permease protein
MFNRFFSELGRTILFLKLVLETLIYRPCTRHEVYEQIWRISVQSVLTTGMAGFFVGAIMAVQFSMQVKEFGAMGFLGGLATSGTVREVGPLLIAFMLSGKIGAFTAAELGTMRVTEQIDAIRCLGADAIREIVLPRFLGIILASFFLLASGLLMSVLGGIAVGALFADINYQEYLRHIPTIVSSFSIFSGLAKCFVFAVVLATICTYRGFNASGGAKGVGLGVVNTAVTTMICIVVADWMTSFFSEVTLRLFFEG